MSCHDGVTSIAINTLLNGPGSGNPTVTPNGIAPPGAIGTVYNGSLFLGWGPNLGGVYPGGSSTVIDLSNDHPVSFEWPSDVPGLQTNPTDTRLRLFGASGRRVECATCHTLHDPANVPFLAMSNENSNMCRACHIK
jgi:predicted CXXCH cytochrome family protein